MKIDGIEARVVDSTKQKLKSVIHLDSFVKGPIPFYEWIIPCMHLSKSALKLGMLLWYLAGLKGKKSVKLNRKLLEDANISDRSYLRAVKELKDAGLIRCEKFSGQRDLIHILTPKKGGETK